MAAGILFMSFDAEEMRLHLKPLSELRYFLRTYGRAGISVFLLQHLYYLLESALILFIIVFGQEAGESLFPVRRYGADTSACAPGVHSKRAGK